MIEVEVNGVIHEFPEGTSQDVIRSALQKKYAPPSQTQETSLPNQAVNLGLTYAQGRSFGMGTKPMSAIGATMAYPVVAAGKAIQGEPIPSWSDLYKIPVEDIQGRIAQSKEDNPYLSIGAEIGGGLKTGADLAKLPTSGGGGFSSWIKNFVSPKGTGPSSQAASMAKKVGIGGILGEATQRGYEAGTAPIGEEAGILLDPTPSLGGMLGAAAPIVSAGLGSAVNAIKPKISADRAKLAKTAIDKYGIPLDVSDISQSGVVGNIQRASQAVPFAGEEVRRNTKLTAFNRAVSKTFGQDISEFTPDAIDNAFIEAGKPFNVLNGKKISVSAQQLKELDDIVDDAAQNIEAGKVEIVRKNVEKLKSQIKNGEINGEVINDIRSIISQNASRADLNARPFISDVVNKIVDISVGGSPAEKAALNEARRNYKNLNVSLNALDTATNSISPTSLESAVKSQKGYGQRSYVRGKAGDLGEIARIGKTFLPVKGGSPTAPIATSAGLGATSLTGLLTMNPVTALSPLAAMGGNRLLQETVNRNPAVVQSMLRQGTNLPALPQSVLRQPIAAGMLGGYLGSQ